MSYNINNTKLQNDFLTTIIKISKLGWRVYTIISAYSTHARITANAAPGTTPLPVAIQ